MLSVQKGFICSDTRACGVVTPAKTPLVLEMSQVLGPHFEVGNVMMRDRTNFPKKLTITALVYDRTCNRFHGHLILIPYTHKLVV